MKYGGNYSISAPVYLMTIFIVDGSNQIRLCASMGSHGVKKCYVIVAPTIYTWFKSSSLHIRRSS